MRRAFLALLLAASCGSGGVESLRGDVAAPVEETTAFVVTTDFQTGSFAAFPVARPESIARDVERIHSDAIVRVHEGLIYVVNRLGGDNVQAIDPGEGFATRWQCSVGNGSNPHDIAFAAPDKAYVTLYERTELLIVDPRVGSDCGGFILGSVDLASLADGDGIPEMDQAIVVGDRLLVTVQRLDRRNFFRPSDRSLVAIIDIATDQLVGSIPLAGTNPFAEFAGLAVDPASGRIALSEVGDFGRADDGGIELLDPVGGRAEGFVVGEADLGGNVTDFVSIDARHAYAIVLDTTARSRVVRFDPATRQVVQTLVTADEFLVDIEAGPDGRTLYLTDRTPRRPGIRVFAIEDDRELTSEPIDTGLPPFDIVFVEGP
jgi:DNA-binding beta-propeller fold protein YncE